MIVHVIFSVAVIDGYSGRMMTVRFFLPYTFLHWLTLSVPVQLHLSSCMPVLASCFASYHFSIVCVSKF